MYSIKRGIKRNEGKTKFARKSINSWKADLIERRTKNEIKQNPQIIQEQLRYASKSGKILLELSGYITVFRISRQRYSKDVNKKGEHWALLQNEVRDDRAFIKLGTVPCPYKAHRTELGKPIEIALNKDDLPAVEIHEDIQSRKAQQFE